MGLKIVGYGDVEMGPRYVILRLHSSLSTGQAMFSLAGISIVSILSPTKSLAYSLLE